MRRGFVGAMMGLGVAVGGCLSPTLPPLPPPDVPQMSYQQKGLLELKGTLSEPRVLLFAFNLENGAIGGQEVTDQRYAFVLPAEPGDPIQLWYSVGGDRSELRTFRAPPYPDAAPDSGVVDASTQPAAGDGGALDSGTRSASDSGTRGDAGL